MSDLTAQRRAELRVKAGYADMQYVRLPPKELGALLDVADERDRLRALLAECREVVLRDDESRIYHDPIPEDQRSDWLNELIARIDAELKEK